MQFVGNACKLHKIVTSAFLQQLYKLYTAFLQLAKKKWWNSLALLKLKKHHTIFFWHFSKGTQITKELDQKQNRAPDAILYAARIECNTNHGIARLLGHIPLPSALPTLANANQTIHFQAYLIYSESVPLSHLVHFLKYVDEIILLLAEVRSDRQFPVCRFFF